MTAPKLILTDDVGGAISGDLTFSSSPGTPTAAQTFRVNNGDGAVIYDDAPAPRLGIVDPGDSNATLARAYRERWYEIKATGNGTATSKLTTPWIPVGEGSEIELPLLEDGEYHEIQIRLSAPGTAPNGDVDLSIHGDPGPRRLALSQGPSESGRDGVRSLVGDTAIDDLLVGCVPLEVGPDEFIAIPDLMWINDGTPSVFLGQNVELTDQDSAAANLAVGESYWNVLSLKSDGTITQTKSVKGTAPLAESLIPSVPAGEVPYAVVERLESGIADANITLTTQPSRFEITDTSDGLNVTIGAGKALVANGLLSTVQPTTLALTASSTNRVWIVPDNDALFDVTTSATPPVGGAYLLYEVTTDGSSVTAVTDRRGLIGGEIVPIAFDIAGALSSGEAITIFPGDRTGYIREVAVALKDPGTGNTAGEVRFEFWKSDGAGGWTTLFTSKATIDRRPILSHDTTEPRLRAFLENGTTRILPEVVALDAFSRVRMTTAHSEAFDGTAATGAVGVLFVEVT